MLFHFIFPVVVIVLLVSSCRSVGPKNIVRDRSAYINAISDSWKNQLLLNIVKLRYADAPVFLEIGNVVNSYEIRGQVNAGMGYESTGSGFMPFLGSESSFSDKPTVSYTPMSGQKFATSMMNPISISTVMGLIYTGYPADMIFRVALHSINGIKNGFSGNIMKTEGSPEFFRLTNLFAKIHGLQLVTVNISGEQNLDLNFNPTNLTDTSTLKEARALAHLLGISYKNRTYGIKYGSKPPDSSTIVLKPRSLLDILTEMGNYVQVPEEHIISNQVSPYVEYLTPDGTPAKPLLTIKSSKDEPASAFFSVKYNDYWFYVDKSDYQTKQVFSFLILLSALTDMNMQKNSPVLTIPAN